MTRRQDQRTAEQVSLALLTRAAFGADAGLQYALHAGVPPVLINRVFARPVSCIRHDVQCFELKPDRRQHTRPAEAM